MSDSFSHTIEAHYDISGDRRIYAKRSLIDKIIMMDDDDYNEICLLVDIVKANPLNCGQESVDYKAGFNLCVKWGSKFNLLYQVHKPTFGPYANHDTVTHIIAVEEFYIRDDGIKVLSIYKNPEALRILLERDGMLVDQILKIY